MPAPPSAPPSSNSISFGATCLRAVLYILITGATMQGVLWEAGQPKAFRFSEIGFTESTQSLCLLISCLLLIHARQVLKGLPHVTLLMFGLTGAALIREQDFFLDIHVFDGAWQTLVTLLVLPISYWIIRHRHDFIREFERFSESFAFGLFASGFLCIFVFSRLYGRGELWETLLAHRYVRVVKDAAEEVTELFGYLLLTYAMIELVLWIRRRSVSGKP